MSQVLAIALVALRNAIRSRMVLCLIALLAVVMLGLPLTIKGDGTPGGHLQVLLSYTLGFATFILALTTLWAGSASVALEVRDKTVQMIVTKPVSAWQLWLGKWTGLLLLNAALLAFCGIVTLMMLQWTLRQDATLGGAQREEITALLSAREVVKPLVPDYRAGAVEELAAHMREHDLPDNVSYAEAVRTFTQRRQARANTLSGAGQLSWRFPALENLTREEIVTLQYRFASSFIGQAPVQGRWQLGNEGGGELREVETTANPRMLNEISFTIDDSWADQPLTLTFIRDEASSTALIFDPVDGLDLLVPRGGFAGNYLRALLVIFGQLAFIGALGVTAGCLFSLPVATFVSLTLLLLVSMGGYIQKIASEGIVIETHSHGHNEPGHVHGPDCDHGHEPANLQQILFVPITYLFKALALFLAPLAHQSALAALSGGHLVDMAWTLRGLLVQGFAYSLLIGALAAAALRRRELALPAL
jgi:hypothetical protein